MCGIAGFIDADCHDDVVLQAMLEAIKHRGPDDEGLFCSAGAFLGHRRLSIIDLAGGKQPLANEDGRFWIVFNGEIYNYQELRQLLIERGHIFQTASDTEVILHLYEEYQEQCLDYLRGMFAFVIWDRERRELFAARDHLGQKPFYYAQSGKRFAFSSEIKGLLAYDSTLRELDYQALDQYLSLRVIAAPRSMFRNISKLPPAHYLKFSEAQGVVVRRYWSLDYEPKYQLSDEDLVDELETKIVESLKLHMVSDVPVGAFVSGGLDSTLVVSLLKERAGVDHLKTFTIGLPYRQYDESPYAKLISEKYGTEHVEWILTPSLIPGVIDMVGFLDEPSDPLSICTYLISQIARQQVKVVVGGDGGDELFGGYDRYYGNLYADYVQAVPVWLRKLTFGQFLDRLPDGKWYKSKTHQLKWLYQMSFEEGGARYARSLSFFYFNPTMKDTLYGPALLEQLGSFDPEADIRTVFDHARAKEPIDRMLSADSSIRLPDHSVMILDRMSMAHGLEVRSPFMDHKLAEYAAHLPMRMKIRGRNLRYIQKQLAQRYLPEEVLQRPKQGFSSALPYMLKDEYQILFEHYLKESRLAGQGLLKQDKVDHLLAMHLAGREDHGNRLWLLLNAEIWYRLYIECESPEDMKSQLLDCSGRLIKKAV